MAAFHPLQTLRSARYLHQMPTLKRDWYAADWLKFVGKSQATTARDLGWNKAKVSLMLRGLQPYDRNSLNELAEYLALEPYELLLPPEQAMAFRKVIAGAEQVTKFAENGGR